MQISEEELRRRLSSNKNLKNSLSDKIVENIHPAKVVNIKESHRENIPQVKNDSIRIVAGILSHTQSVSSVARELNLTPQQVDSAKNSPVLRSKINNGLERIRELALDKLCLALGLMTQKKFKNAQLKHLSI